MAYTQAKLKQLKHMLNEDGYKTFLVLSPGYVIFTNNIRFVLFDTRGRTHSYKTIDEVFAQLEPERFAVTEEDLLSVELDEGIRTQLGSIDGVAYVNPHDRRQFFVEIEDGYLVVDPSLRVTHLYNLSSVLSYFSDLTHLYCSAALREAYPESYWFLDPGIDITLEAELIQERVEESIAKRRVLA